MWKNVLKSENDAMEDYKIDVDFLVPMIPLEEKPSGQITAARDYLMRNKPVGECHVSIHYHLSVYNT